MTISILLASPTTIKILLVLLDAGQAYQFQLVRITGAHPATIKTALKILQDLRLVKTVPPDRQVKNAGEFYGLTPHGMRVATHLKAFATSLETSK